MLGAQGMPIPLGDPAVRRAMDAMAVPDAVKKKFFQSNAERWFKL